MKQIELVQTCEACPEQYDAYIGDTKIGYLRLRFGEFTVRYPDVQGQLVLSVNTRGDGMFEDEERELMLNMAKQALIAAMEQPTRKNDDA